MLIYLISKTISVIRGEHKVLWHPVPLELGGQSTEPQLLQGQGLFGMGFWYSGEGKGQHPFLHGAETGTSAGREAWESHPHTLKLVYCSKGSWLSLPGREWLKAPDPGSQRSDNSSVAFPPALAPVPSSDVCWGGRDGQEEHRTRTLLCSCLLQSSSTPGSR